MSHPKCKTCFGRGFIYVDGGYRTHPPLEEPPTEPCPSCYVVPKRDVGIQDIVELETLLKSGGLLQIHSSYKETT